MMGVWLLIKPEQIAGASETSQQQALFVWSSLNRDKYHNWNGYMLFQMLIAHKQVAEGVRGGVADNFFTAL